jgi:hypothetical protein
MRRSLLTLTVGMAMIAATASCARAEGAGRADFDTLVRTLSAQDGVTCTSPPMMWLARLAVRAAQPEGVLDVRLATFEGGGLSRVANDDKFNRLLQAVPNEGWAPLVRVRSRKHGTISTVHVRQQRDRVSLLVVAIDRDDAAIVEVTVKPETLTRWLEEPHSIARRTH